MFKVSYFLEVLPIIASKVNITFELTVAATIFALIVGVIIAIIGYYKIPVLYQLTRVYVSIMRGTPVVAQLYFFYYGIALYSAFVRNMTPLIAVAVVMSFNMELLCQKVSEEHYYPLMKDRKKLHIHWE